MTLIVSVRSADGIVIAGDSLSSLNRQININQPGKITCPQCQHEHTVTANFQGNVRESTFSHTEKVLPFLKKFGIGIFGSGIIGGNSVNFLIRALEHRVKESGGTINSVTQLAEEIGISLHELLKKQLEIEKQPLDNFPDNHIFLGFQIVGYDKLQPKTIEVLLGKDVKFQSFDRLGCSASGSKEVVEAIWNLNQTIIDTNPIYEVFSLQESIDYVDFLISSTIAFQRFSPRTPTVGGEIDIALVRPFDKFQWIRQKPLGELLQGG